MDNKVLGYVVSGIGIIVLALSFLRKTILSFLPASIDKNDVLITGILIVVVGVVLAYSKSSSSYKVKQSHEEVPIYEGEGKNRKIVAYRKENN